MTVAHPSILLYVILKKNKVVSKPENFIISRRFMTSGNFFLIDFFFSNFDPKSEIVNGWYDWICTTGFVVLVTSRFK